MYLHIEENPSMVELLLEREFSAYFQSTGFYGGFDEVASRENQEERKGRKVFQLCVLRGLGVRNILSRNRYLAASAFSFSPPMPSIRPIRGRNIAMTMLPTITARKTIMIGSSREVMAATALSTSSS